MAALVDIANRALVLLGEKRITSLDDGTKGAATCKSQIDLTRQAELRGHRWAFALKRAQLPALTTVPLFGFVYAYQMPVDLLRLDQVGDFFIGASLTNYVAASEAAYAIEGRQILTNLGAPLDIRYGADIVDATQFDALFVDAMSHRLAIDVCYAMTNSNAKESSLGAKYQAVVALAVSINAVERPPETLPDDSWILSRL